MDKKYKSIYDNAKWKRDLNDEEKYLYDLIMKGHAYYSGKDRFYKNVVRTVKVVVLFLSLCSTIVLGMNGLISLEMQVNAGLVLSAIISFATGFSAYFNFEKYWMRNIKCHISFNIIRDNFVYDIKKTKALSEEQLKSYLKQLNDIQDDNKIYWQKVMEKAE